MLGGWVGKASRKHDDSVHSEVVLHVPTQAACHIFPLIVMVSSKTRRFPTQLTNMANSFHSYSWWKWNCTATESSFPRYIICFCVWIWMCRGECVFCLMFYEDKNPQYPVQVLYWGLMYFSKCLIINMLTMNKFQLYAINEDHNVHH